MSVNPLVSIIIPTYNRAAIIGRAIKSALDQTYTNIEVLVVDDGSTDDTATVVKAFPQVKYILQPHERQAAARNKGKQHARGKYIATLDSDDIWHRDFLERCVNFIEQHQLDFVFANWDQERKEGGTFDFLSSDPLLTEYLPRLKDSWVILGPEDLHKLYIQGCPSPSSSLLMNASSLEHGWNEKMNIGDDWCMLLDLIMSRPCKAAFTLETLWWKHVNHNNVYDGRDHKEVNRLLYVEDLGVMMSRFAHALTKEEYKSIEKRYLRNLIRSATHSAFTYSNMKDALRLAKRALFTNPLFSIRIFFNLMSGAIKRQFTRQRRRISEI